MWRLPLVGMLGVSGCAMFAFSSGVFMVPMSTAFGWTRAQFSSAFVLQMVAGLVILPVIGRLTDRVGPRRVALIGIPIFALSFSALALNAGSLWQWWVICLLVAIAQGFIAQTVWVTGVISRFHTSRGLALAVALAGLGLGSLLWPLMATYYVGLLGWRLAFPALALSWAAVLLPLAWTAFNIPRPESGKEGNGTAHLDHRGVMMSPIFLSLVAGGGLFASAYFGLSVHLVPILSSRGLPPVAAAALLGLVGLFSIIGRLATGHLLDRLPTRPVTMVAFVLPAIASFILLKCQGSLALAIAAVALLGLASGAELDVITFIAARRFGKEVFASVYSTFTAVISLCASSGPLLAGALFDTYKNYSMFLMLVPAMAIAGAALTSWIPDGTESDF